MRTSINLPDSLVLEIREFNREHPERQIGMSGTCRKSLEKALENAKKVK